MSDLLGKLRQRSVQDRRVIALTTAGVLVMVLFVVWANAFESNLAQTSKQQSVRSIQEEQQASVFEGVKRKARLLFGEGSPIRNIDFGITKPVEYKKDDVSGAISTEQKSDLQAILDAFNASSSEESSTSTEVSNDENSF